MYEVSGKIIKFICRQQQNANGFTEEMKEKLDFVFECEKNLGMNFTRGLANSSSVCKSKSREVEEHVFLIVC